MGSCGHQLAFVHPLRDQLLPSEDYAGLEGMGAFSAFIVALFTEMFSDPLTVYLLTGPFAGTLPGIDLSHDAGHLWTDATGWGRDPHFSPFLLASYVLIGAGFWLISVAWRHLHAAQRTGRLAVEGRYARVHHPQYIGLILVMVGFLPQGRPWRPSSCSRS